MSRPEDALTVLLVEDNELDRMLVRRLLPRAYEVHEATTGQDGLARLDALAPDLVLLDNRLPDADGLDLLPQFLERGPAVIMLTGVEDPATIVEAIQAGAHDYLVKGKFTAERLTYSIQGAVRRVQLQNQLAERERALAAKQEQVRALASALTLAQHDERHRIAVLLHDELQQQLVAARMGLYGLQADAHDPEAVEAHATDLDGALQRAIRTTRSLAVDLTPPVLDGEPLRVALDWVAARIEERHGLRVHVTTEADVPVLSRGLRVLLIELVRELLFNVVKHAGVQEVRLNASLLGDQVALEVADQGVGFDTDGLDAAAATFGLPSVRHRIGLVGGRLEIESAPSEGARIRVLVPAEAHAPTPAEVP